MDHPQLGPITVVNCPLRFSETPAAIAAPESPLGQHNEDVLRFLAYSAEEIGRLQAEGVV